MSKQKSNLIRDLAIIAFSIIIAVLLAKTGALKELLAATHEWKIFSSLLAGMFFVSVFTAAPAVVVLIKIAQTNSILTVAFFAAIGALIGDLVIYYFIKDSLLKDINWLIKKTGRQRFMSIFRLKIFKWLTPLLGAIIIASPIPDEIGLAMMGFSKMKTAIFIPVSFLLNFFGILIICLVAKGI